MKRNTMFTLKYEYCGFEKFWITTVKGEIGWQDQKVTMYKLTFPFFLNGRQSLKTLHVLFKTFSQLKQFYARYGVLWSRGYFASTVGHISEATVIQYMEEQKNHGE